MVKGTHPKRIFIGGIAGGIGSAVAQRMRQSGMLVGGFGRESGSWETFSEKNSDLDLYVGDANDGREVDQIVDDFSGKYGGLDAYVHAIGSVHLMPLHMISDEEWYRVMRTNLDSAFFAARAAVKAMRRNKGGTIIFLSSVAALSGLSNHEAIAAAKGGVIGLSRSIAATYAPYGIRSNTVAPGLVDTPATRTITRSEQALKISERMHPLGRIGKSGEVASLIGWLLSEEASWVTGQNFSIDGGMGALTPKVRA